MFIRIVVLFFENKNWQLYSMTDQDKQNNMFVSCHMLNKIKLGSFNFFFYKFNNKR